MNPDGLRSVIRTILAHSGRLAALGWGLVAFLWLLDAAGHGLPTAFDQLVVILAAATLAVFLGQAGRRLWAGEGDGGSTGSGRTGSGRTGGGRTAGRVLLLLVAVAIGFHFFGLEHEADSRYFGDEGIYRQHAERINGGELFRPWFVYPHLLFYLDAVALWLAALFEPLTLALAKGVYGVTGGTAVGTLVTRSVTAACGALTVIPVFAVARRLAGTAAAGLAGAFIALSPLYLEVCHLNISDVPAAFFATLTVMQVSRLLERERLRDYVLAGIWAGLAAGSKYPGGVVAVAIVAPWLRWRLREGRFGWGLAGAAIAAAGAFVASTPSLVVFSDAVYDGGGGDILFGYRQYAREGWTGVVKDSNVFFYLEMLRRSFGEPILLLGATGLATLGRAAGSRLAWLLPFPAVYLALLLSMNMAVKRNLLPLLPMLAVILGAGVAGWLRWLARRPVGRPVLARAVLPALLIVCLALPAVKSSGLVVKLARPTTRDLAAAWMIEHLPPGSFLVQEAYTPRVGPPYRFPSRRPRFATRLSDDQLRDPRYDFVFLADAAYSRFLQPRNRRHQASLVAATAERYREIFDTFEPVREWAPGPLRQGPVLRLYKIDPESLVYATEGWFSAGEALLREPRMRPPGEDVLVYTQPHQWGLFKAYLAAGTYRIELDAELDAEGGTVRVMDRDNREIDSREITAEVAEIELPRDDKVFLYLHLPAGSRLSGMTLTGQRSRG